MMKKKRMIASLLVFVVSGTILPGADIPFAERDPDKFPSQSLVNFALREVHDGFIHPKQGRDNWTLFIPLLERVAKYRGSVGKEDVASVEARIVSWFTLYAFACEYDSDPVKAEFGGRLDCLRRIGEFDLIRSDTNTLFQVSDWLAEAVALAVDDDTQCRELTEAKRKDSIILYGEGIPTAGSGDFISRVRSAKHGHGTGSPNLGHARRSFVSGGNITGGCRYSARRRWNVFIVP